MQRKPDTRRESAVAARLAYAGYDALGILAALVCVPALPLLLRRGYAAGAAERLGRLPGGTGRLAARPLWIHCASVGETLAAAPLVERVRERCPDLPIVMSNTTVTGRAVALNDLRVDLCTLLPVDALRVVDRVFRRVRPRCLVLVETELWPGLLRAAARVQAPTAVVSGRLSARGLRRYLWAGPLFRCAVQQVAAFGMQTRADAERIVELGAPAERVRVTGSLKASRQPAVVAAPCVEASARRPLLIAASTQPGEEEFALAACDRLWRSHPSALLLLAPRRPERFESVGRLVREAAVRYERRSAMRGVLADDTQVLVLDTLGELARYFPLAAGVFVGGTIAPLGGHNVLEPATYGRPVAFGPHTGNVAEAARALCDAAAGLVVREPRELAAHWADLLARPEQAAAMGERARAVAVRVGGLEETWAMLVPLLGVGA